MKKIILTLVFLLFTFSFVHADSAMPGPPPDEDSKGDDPEVTEDGQLKQAVDNGQDAKVPEGKTLSYNGFQIQGPASYTAGEGFSTPEDSPIIGPDGNKYAGDGIQIENGEVKNADNFKLQTSQGKSEGRNAQDMNFNPPRYTIGSADYWKTPTHTVISGSGITKGECFRVEEGQSVHADAVTSTFEDYEDCDLHFPL